MSSTDYEGRQFWVAAAERDDAGRFLVRADEKVSAFMALEAVIRLARPIRRQRVSENPITLSGYILHNL